MNEPEQNHKWHPVTWIIIIVIIGILLAIAIPSFIKERNHGAQNACINNLRMIDEGKRQAELANKWAETNNPTVHKNSPAVK